MYAEPCDGPVCAQNVANGGDICVYVCVCVYEACNELYVYKKMENIQKTVTYTLMPKQ